VPSQTQADKKQSALKPNRAAVRQKAARRCRAFSEHCWQIPTGVASATAYLPAAAAGSVGEENTARLIKRKLGFSDVSKCYQEFVSLNLILLLAH